MAFDPVTALIDLGGRLFGDYQQDKRTELNRQWQEQMYKMQLADQRENWRMVNEYNLPINQRKRLEDAGINPNLAFGGSASVTSGNIGGASVPSPTPGSSKMGLGEFYLRKKQIDAEVKRINAQTNKDNETTEQLRMNNEMMAQLFQDMLATKQGDLYVQRIAQGWKEDNLRHALDVGLENDEAKRDYQRLEQLFIKAQTEKTEKSALLLKQEYEHLIDKYNFEKFYYDMRTNPYETSTILGMFRGIFGPVSQWLEYLFPGLKN